MHRLPEAHGLADTLASLHRKKSTSRVQPLSPLRTSFHGKIRELEQKSAESRELDTELGVGSLQIHGGTRGNAGKANQRYGGGHVAGKTAADFVVVVGRDNPLKMSELNLKQMRAKWNGSHTNDRADLQKRLTRAPSRSRALTQAKMKGPGVHVLSEDMKQVYEYYEPANVKIVRENTEASLSKQRYQWVKGFKIKGLKRGKFLSASREQLEKARTLERQKQEGTRPQPQMVGDLNKQLSVVSDPYAVGIENGGRAKRGRTSALKETCPSSLEVGEPPPENTTSPAESPSHAATTSLNHLDRGTFAQPRPLPGLNSRNDSSSPEQDQLRIPSPSAAIPGFLAAGPHHDLSQDEGLLPSSTAKYQDLLQHSDRLLEQMKERGADYQRKRKVKATFSQSIVEEESQSRPVEVRPATQIFRKKTKQAVAITDDDPLSMYVGASSKIQKLQANGKATFRVRKQRASIATTGTSTSIANQSSAKPSSQKRPGFEGAAERYASAAQQHTAPPGQVLAGQKSTQPTPRFPKDGVADSQPRQQKPRDICFFPRGLDRFESSTAEGREPRLLEEKVPDPYANMY